MSARAPFRNRSAVLLALYNESIKRGWTYEQMAAAAGVERNTVTSWCRGNRTPNAWNLELWAKAMGGHLELTWRPTRVDAVDRVDRHDGQQSTNGAF